MKASQVCKVRKCSFGFIAVVVCMFLAACSEKMQLEPTIIYVTATGSKYHLSSCRHLGEVFTPVLISEVDEKGYAPCSNCMPPLSTPINQLEDAAVNNEDTDQKDDVSLTERKQTPVQCTGITKKGIQCSRRVKSPDHKCFQHKKKR